MTTQFTTAMTGLKAVVEKEFLGRVKAVFDRVDCGYMYTTKRKVIDGLCSGTVYGIIFLIYSYFAAGALAMILAILTFLVWRHAQDNLSLWDETMEDGESMMMKAQETKRQRRSHV